MVLSIGLHQNKKSTTFPLHQSKIHTGFIFSSCVVNNSFKSLFRPQYQSTSKDFNQIGGKFGQNFCFGLDFDPSSGF